VAAVELVVGPGPVEPTVPLEVLPAEAPVEVVPSSLQATARGRARRARRR
jgi:hypothetical protein